MMKEKLKKISKWGVIVALAGYLLAVLSFAALNAAFPFPIEELENWPASPVVTAKNGEELLALVATDDQWRALVARDGGCFCCPADPSHCEAHHLHPWATGGSTDIDDMVLVCNRTHHLIHDFDYQIIWTDNGWKLLPPTHTNNPDTQRGPPHADAA